MEKGEDEMLLFHIVSYCYMNMEYCGGDGSNGNEKNNHIFDNARMAYARMA